VGVARHDAEFCEDAFRRAKPGYRRLNEVAADENRKQKPPRADQAAQQNAQKNQRSGKNSNGMFGGHRFFSLPRTATPLLVD